jgi:uncharacterized protein
MWRSVLVAFAAAASVLALPLTTSPASAQAIPKSLQEGGTETAIKNRKNLWTVGVAGGLIDGTYMRFADELGKVLDDGDNLRILPIVSYGAASNLEDLIYLRGVDVAVTQSDVFEYFRTERKTPNLDRRVHFITRLPVSEVQILARTDIKSLEDLRGKKVNFGPAGSGSSLTGTIIFQRLGIQVETVNIDQQSAMQKLRAGEVSALVRVIGKPVGFFANVPANSGLHLLPVPFTKQFADYYTLGELTSKDYPTLIPDGQRVDTIAVPTVLAVFNWPKGSDRYRRVERFTERLFANWDKFLQPSRHPKWKEVNLAATVPGWTRFGFAEETLQKYQAKEPNSAELNRDFQAFLDRPGGRASPANQTDRDALFREFMQWRDQQAARRRQ